MASSTDKSFLKNTEVRELINSIRNQRSFLLSKTYDDEGQKLLHIIDYKNMFNFKLPVLIEIDRRIKKLKQVHSLRSSNVLKTSGSPMPNQCNKSYFDSKPENQGTNRVVLQNIVPQIPSTSTSNDVDKNNVSSTSTEKSTKNDEDEDDVEKAENYIRCAISLLNPELESEQKRKLKNKLVDMIQEAKNTYPVNTTKTEKNHTTQMSELQSLFDTSSMYYTEMPSKRLRTRKPMNFQEPESEMETSDDNPSDTEYPKRRRSDKNQINVVNNNIPNTNPDIHVANPQYKKHCALCGVERQNMVLHYEKYHPNHEIFISRLPPDTVEQLKSPAKEAEFSETFFIIAHCHFCQMKRTFHESYWPTHILTHTGERDHYCHACKRKSSAHSNHINKCGQNIEQLFLYNFEENYLTAFMCKQCNFVQVLTQNIEKHLLNEHKMKKEDVQQNYFKIYLVTKAMCMPQVNVKPERLHYEAIEAADEISDYERFEEPVELEIYDEADVDEYTEPAMCCETEWQGDEQNEQQMQTDEVPNEPQSIPESVKSVKQISLKLSIKFENQEIQRMTTQQRDAYLSLHAFYGEKLKDEYLYDATPYLEDPKSNFKQFRPITLYALFKCMSENCIFSTNDASKMLLHLKDHQILLELQEANKKIPDPNDNQFEYNEKEFLFYGWQRCSYCSFKKNLPQEIVNHIQHEHGHCPFQCSSCFFRAADPGYFDQHFEEFHPDDEKREIYLCNVKSKTNDEYKEDLLMSRNKYMMPFVCDKAADCQKKFFMSFYFEDHILKDHMDRTEFTCTLCKCSIDKLAVLTHMRGHQLNEFQCLYCSSGYREMITISAHVFNSHPNKLAAFAVRRFKDPCDVLNNDPTKIDSTIMVLFGTSAETFSYVLCKFTDDQLNFMGPKLAQHSQNFDTPKEMSDVVPYDTMRMLNSYTFGKDKSSPFLTMNEFRILYPPIKREKIEPL